MAKKKDTQSSSDDAEKDIEKVVEQKAEATEAKTDSEKKENKVEETEDSIEITVEQEGSDSKQDDEDDKNDSGDLIVLEIPQNLDLDASTELFEKIKAGLDEKKDIEVKANKVETISTAAVQVFISTSRYAKENNLSLKWVSPSEAIGNTFSDIGLFGQLMTMEFV